MAKDQNTNCSRPSKQYWNHYHVYCRFCYLILGASNYLCQVSSSDLDYLEQYTTTPGPPVPIEFLQRAEIVMEEERLHMPQTVVEALDLYIELLSAIED